MLKVKFISEATANKYYGPPSKGSVLSTNLAAEFSESWTLMLEMKTLSGPIGPYSILQLQINKASWIRSSLATYEAEIYGQFTSGGWSRIIIVTHADSRIYISHQLLYCE